MTMPASSQWIHPEFRQIFESYAEGFEFEPGARRLILKLLAQGSEAFPKGEEGLLDENLEEAKSRLDYAMSAVADELRSQGASVVDTPSLSLLMQAQCPLPPFCYGLNPPPGISLTSDPAPEAARPPASAGT